MHNNKTKIFVAAVLLFVELAVFPLSALAQIPSINPVPTSDSALGSGGITGTAANTAAASALSGVDVANKSCATAEAAYETTDNAAQLGFSGLSIIGGDSVLLGQLTAKINAYKGFITCRQGVLDSVRAVVSPNIYTSNLKQRMEDQQIAAIAAWRVKMENAQARYNNAKQGFWKTLVFNILIKTSKAVATSLVQKLVSNYKVRNIMQYTDSVATLMYDNQFIRQNFPNAEGQFMARAILENPLVRNKVPSAVFIAADNALGFDPSTVNVNDPNFYTKMSAVGSTVANPYFQHTTNIGGVDQARAASLAYAQQQVAQSSGLKTPVTCAGSMANQQSVDARYKAASNKFDDRWALLRNLQQAKELGQPVSDSDLAKAQADFDQARTALQVLPQAVNTPATTICEAIVSPPSLINKGIDQAFEAIGINMKQYNDNNLPGFMSMIGDVASQIGSSLIFGGVDGAKSAALINEERVAKGAVQAGTEALYSNASENLAKGIELSAYSNDAGTWYDLYWDIVPLSVLDGKVSFVTIAGEGVSATKIDPTTKASVPNKQPPSGSVRVYPTKSGPYIITVFDANGRAITSATMNLTVTGTQPQAYNNNSQTAVLGAFTDKPSLNIRGGNESIHPRGLMP
ncbi:MAG: hypothetical protein HY918_02090 [Candidatus Doudnabacteria bacterium]|nr:hypothetical protein [Candidatus Doudnabacteria bacterium]